MDHAGHDFGPGSPELRTAVSHLDTALQQLLDGVTRAGVADRTTIVVVSDHGMAASSEQRLVFLDDYIDLDTVDVIEGGEFLQVAPLSGTVEALYAKLHGKVPHLTVYRRDQIPARYHYRENPRIAPVVALVDEGWILTSHRAEAKRKPDAKKRNGSHGYDPALRSMHGLFAAAGPGIRDGLVVRAVPEHSRLRLHVPGAESEAGAERRRPRGDQWVLSLVRRAERASAIHPVYFLISVSVASAFA